MRSAVDSMHLPQGGFARLRRQLPALSPLSLDTLAAASVRLGQRDPIQELGAWLSREMGAQDVLLVESGTQALTVALEVVGRGRRPRVALPAFACYDVATAAVGADADVVLYDLDPSSLSPDPGSLERALRSGVDGVVVAPLYGIPVDWEGLAAQVRGAGAILIEDAAQGHGARVGGAPLGSLGDYSILSFGRGKGWTGGGGGALLARNGVPLPRAAPGGPRPLRPLLGAWVQWAIGRPALFGLPHLLPWLHLGETVYQPPQPVAAMGRRPAALVLSTRAMADREAERRREAGRWYRERIEAMGDRFAVPSPPEDGVAGYLRFPVRVLEGAASVLKRPETRRAGLAPSYPGPLSELPALRDRLRAPARWPGAEELARELLTLPTHGLVSVPDRTAVLAILMQGSG